ncbi:DUF3962 domain-containing protein [Sphaerisporangium sp. NPDC051017]|uniref:pPIWI_RE module domain-containing protein n=1 Tax=Sphaerisporangium sp. NPDC051017 TaxID=3154636 RepID=UPI00341A2382
MAIRYNHLLTPTFTFAENASLEVSGYQAVFPPQWLERLETAWRDRPGHRGGSLPTSDLIELLHALDTRVTSVSWKLDSEHWIRASAPLDSEVVLLAIEAWALSHVAPHRDDINWYDVLSPISLDWRPYTLNLFDRDLHPNGTAHSASHVFDLLPSYLAEQICDSGLVLRHQPRAFVLGPTSSDGRRAAYLWPPTHLTDNDEASGLWTPYINFHLETTPHVPLIRVHAELHMARMAALPLAYIPRRSSKQRTVSIMMLAPEGFLHGQERPTLLKAPAVVRGRGEDTTWSWQPGLAHALATLTRHPHPDPDKVRNNPIPFPEDKIAAYVLHSNGITYKAPKSDADAALAQAASEGKDRVGRKPATLDHPAMPGFQPIDHLEVFDRLTVRFASIGLLPSAPIPRAKTRAKALLHPPQNPGRHYILELWTSSPRTRDALLAALVHKLHLTPHHAPNIDLNQTTPLTYSGDFTLTVHLCDPKDLTSGIPRSESRDRELRRRELLKAETARARRITEEFPRTQELRACVVEMQGAAYFSRNNQGDPKNLFKQTLPTLNRRVQCMRPVIEKPASEDGKKGRKKYRGTTFTSEDIERATSSILDALRQVGHIPDLPVPLGTQAPFEVATVWIASAGKQVVPMLIRMRTDGVTTAQLMATPAFPVESEIPFTFLPEALVAGRGRITMAKSRAALISFIKEALALDSSTPRLFIARAARLRNDGIWPWLQDSHIMEDALIHPGVSLKSQETAPTPRKPDDHPGLRIIRIREGGNERAEVSKGFGVAQDANGDRVHGRISGLMEVTSRTYIGVNPRSEQNRTPKDLSKLDLAKTGNATWTSANPSSLEIHVAFFQHGDRPADLAMYVQSLRRYYSHTSIDTELPLIMHIAALMQEYLN